MLFDVSHTIDVFGFKLKRIDSECETLFWEYSQNSGYDRVSYFSSFYYLYPIDLYTDNTIEIYYLLFGDWMLLFELNTKSKIFRALNSPINRNGDYSDMRKIYKVLFAMLSKLNGSCGKVNFVYRMCAADLDKYINKERVRYQLGYKEFIFRCSDLIELKGKDYKSRRHMVNRLKQEHPNVFVRPYLDDDKDAVLGIYKKWLDFYSSRFNDAVVTNAGLVEGTLEHFNKSDRYRIFVSVINDEIKGFIVITPLCKNTSCVLIEFTDLDIKGLSEYLWYEGLRHTQDLGEFENDGTGGTQKDSLFAYKNSHRPIAFNDTYELSLNKKDRLISKSVFKLDVEVEG